MHFAMFLASATTMFAQIKMQCAKNIGENRRNAAAAVVSFYCEYFTHGVSVDKKELCALLRALVFQAALSLLCCTHKTRADRQK